MEALGSVSSLITMVKDCFPWCACFGCPPHPGSLSDLYSSTTFNLLCYSPDCFDWLSLGVWHVCGCGQIPTICREHSLQRPRWTCAKFIPPHSERGTVPTWKGACGIVTDQGPLKDSELCQSLLLGRGLSELSLSGPLLSSSAGLGTSYLLHLATVTPLWVD